MELVGLVDSHHMGPQGVLDGGGHGDRGSAADGDLYARFPPICEHLGAGLLPRDVGVDAVLDSYQVPHPLNSKPLKPKP